MIAEIEKIIDRLRALQQRGLSELVGELIAENAPMIEDLQTEQLWQGKDSEGNDITPAYSPFTVQIKRSKGQPTNRVTLRDEGDFYQGMFLSGGANGSYAIGNRDQKAKKLMAKYGDEILGLNDDSKQKVIDEILRIELPERVRKFMLQ